jgi:hypothetical protein
MTTAVPEIEVADDADATGVGRPDGKADAGDAVEFADVSAELQVFLVVSAFADEMKIEIGEQRRERVRVGEFVGRSRRERRAETIGRERLRGSKGKESFEESGGVNARGEEGFAAFEKNENLAGVGMKNTNGKSRGAGVRMRAEHVMGVAMYGANNFFDFDGLSAQAGRGRRERLGSACGRQTHLQDGESILLARAPWRNRKDARSDDR